MIRAMDAPRAKACHNRYAFFMTVGDDTCETSLAGLSIHHGDHNGYLSLVSAKFGTPR
jgi:hypothetical protein